MVCADGVYELCAIDGTKFLAEAKKPGKSMRNFMSDKADCEENTPGRRG